MLLLKKIKEHMNKNEEFQLKKKKFSFRIQNLNWLISYKYLF